MWIASAGSIHRVASGGMLHVSCHVDVPYSNIATPRLMKGRKEGYGLCVASNDKRVSSLPLTCTVQQVGAFTIACRLLCLRRCLYAESAIRANMSFRSPMHLNGLNGDGNP